MPFHIRKLLDQLLKCKLDTTFESIRNVLELSQPEKFEPSSTECKILLTMEEYIQKLNLEVWTITVA